MTCGARGRRPARSVSEAMISSTRPSISPISVPDAGRAAAFGVAPSIQQKKRIWRAAGASSSGSSALAGSSAGTARGGVAGAGGAGERGVAGVDGTDGTGCAAGAAPAGGSARHRLVNGPTSASTTCDASGRCDGASIAKPGAPTHASWRGCSADDVQQRQPERRVTAKASVETTMAVLVSAGRVS